jgi:hypothetical protein
MDPEQSDTARDMQGGRQWKEEQSLSRFYEEQQEALFRIAYGSD